MSCAVHTRGESPQDGLEKCVDLLNDLDFSLCAVLPVCHVVATSDNRKKSEMGVSADFGVSLLNTRD